MINQITNINRYPCILLTLEVNATNSLDMSSDIETHIFAKKMFILCRLTLYNLLSRNSHNMPLSEFCHTMLSDGTIIIFIYSLKCTSDMSLSLCKKDPLFTLMSEIYQFFEHARSKQCCFVETFASFYASLFIHIFLMLLIICNKASPTQ